MNTDGRPRVHSITEPEPTPAAFRATSMLARIRTPFGGSALRSNDSLASLNITVNWLGKPQRIAIDRSVLDRALDFHHKATSDCFMQCNGDVSTLAHMLRKPVEDFFSKIIQHALDQLALPAESETAKDTGPSVEPPQIGPGSLVARITKASFYVAETIAQRVLVIHLQNSNDEALVGALDAANLPSFTSGFLQALRQFSNGSTVSDDCSCVRCQLRRAIEFDAARLLSAAQSSPRQ